MAFNFQEIVDQERFDKDLIIDEDNLSDGFIKQPSWVAHYGVLFAKAERQHAEAKMNLDKIISDVDRALRLQAKQNNEKITEASINKTVDRHPRVIEATRLVILAREQETSLKAYNDAFRHRKDSLWSLALMKRAEMEGDLVVNKREAAALSRQEAKAKIDERVKEAANS